MCVSEQLEAQLAGIGSGTVSISEVGAPEAATMTTPAWPRPLISCLWP